METINIIENKIEVIKQDYTLFDKEVLHACFITGATYQVPSTNLISKGAEVQFTVIKNTHKSVTIEVVEKYNDTINASKAVKRLNTSGGGFWKTIQGVEYAIVETFNANKLTRWVKGYINPFSCELATKELTVDSQDVLTAETIEKVEKVLDFTPVYYTIDEKMARLAREMNSFREYEENSTTEYYKARVKEVFSIAEKNQSEKSLYLANIYAKKYAEYINNSNRVDSLYPSIMVCGAGNFNVRKKEKQNARRDNLMKDFEKLQNLLEKIKRPDGWGYAEIKRDTITTNEFESIPYFNVVTNEEVNRLQLVDFEEIPTDEQKSILKHNGFKWSPRFQAWQRQLTENAINGVWRVVREFERLENEEIEELHATIQENKPVEPVEEVEKPEPVAEVEKAEVEKAEPVAEVEKAEVENAETVEEVPKAEPVETVENAEPAEKDIDYTLMSDNDLHDVVLSQLDYINRDLMETCVYNDLNGNGKYVHVSDNDFMDVTPALTEYNRRFGTTEIFCLIYRHFESRKTHVEYDSFDDTMYIVEVIPHDDDGNIIEYGYYVGDYYVRYSGVTENIEIVEVNETETTNETKNEKEVKKAMKKTNREFKVNNTTYSVVNNPNYNKEFAAFEPSSMKYYAMKLLTTDNTTKSWVKTGITGNTIDKVKEKVAEWEDFMKYVDSYDSTKTAEIVEPFEPIENAEPVQEVEYIEKNSVFKVGYVYTGSDKVQYFVTNRGLNTIDIVSITKDFREYDVPILTDIYDNEYVNILYSNLVGIISSTDIRWTKDFKSILLDFVNNDFYGNDVYGKYTEEDVKRTLNALYGESID